MISASFPLAKADEACYMADPLSFAVDARSGIIIPHNNLIQRHVSHMRGISVGEASLKARLESEESTS